MESLSFEQENIIKDIRNLFRLKQELNYTAIGIKNITNLFRIEKETNTIKDYLEILRIFLSMKKRKKIIIKLIINVL